MRSLSGELIRKWILIWITHTRWENVNSSYSLYNPRDSKRYTEEASVYQLIHSSFTHSIHKYALEELLVMALSSEHRKITRAPFLQGKAHSTGRQRTRERQAGQAMLQEQAPEAPDGESPKLPREREA